MEKKVALYRSGKADDAKIAAVDERLTGLLAELDSDIAFVVEVNTGGEFLQDEAIERLENIAAKTFPTAEGDQNYLTENELDNLKIRKGTLTEEEREVINNHVVATIKMLGEIPFPKKMSNVVEYAGAHHEKLNGTGYPNGLSADDLAVQSRILCLADVCEALTARDRPYKPAMPLEKAFQILGFMVKDGEIDPQILDMFLEQRVYERYMEEYEAAEAAKQEQEAVVAAE